MTLSPNTLTSIAPFDRSTNRVRISRIAFERALISMAQMPRMMGGRVWSVIAERSECEPLGDGEDILGLDADRGPGERSRERTGDISSSGVGEKPEKYGGMSCLLLESKKDASGGSRLHECTPGQNHEQTRGGAQTPPKTD